MIDMKRIRIATGIVAVTAAGLFAAGCGSSSDDVKNTINDQIDSAQKQLDEAQSSGDLPDVSDETQKQIDDIQKSIDDAQESGDLPEIPEDLQNQINEAIDQAGQ